MPETALAQILAERFVFDNVVAFPEKVDKAVVAGDLFNRRYERGDRLAGYSENVEEFVQKVCLSDAARAEGAQSLANLMRGGVFRSRRAACFEGPFRAIAQLRGGRKDGVGHGYENDILSLWGRGVKRTRRRPPRQAAICNLLFSFYILQSVFFRRRLTAHARPSVP